MCTKLPSPHLIPEPFIGTKAMASSAYVPPEEAHRLHSVMLDQSVSQQVLRVQKTEDVDSTPLGITADFSYE